MQTRVRPADALRLVVALACVPALTITAGIAARSAAPDRKPPALHSVALPNHWRAITHDANWNKARQYYRWVTPDRILTANAQYEFEVRDVRADTRTLLPVFTHAVRLFAVGSPGYISSRDGLPLALHQAEPSPDGHLVLLKTRGEKMGVMRISTGGLWSWRPEDALEHIPLWLQGSSDWVDLQCNDVGVLRAITLHSGADFAKSEQVAVPIQFQTCYGRAENISSRRVRGGIELTRVQFRYNPLALDVVTTRLTGASSSSTSVTIPCAPREPWFLNCVALSTSPRPAVAWATLAPVSPDERLPKLWLSTGDHSAPCGEMTDLPRSEKGSDQLPHDLRWLPGNSGVSLMWGHTLYQLDLPKSIRQR